jgi:DHA2 family multidrug resistance protein
MSDAKAPKKGSGGADATAWLAVAAGTIGAFMATLDTSIVNTALPKIQGEIGASQTEGTWISTAYLVAEIVMIPLAGWFEKMLSLRVLLLFSTIVFTASSIFCGLSENLVEMIIGRVGQGFSGGAFIPTALSIVATRLPPEKQPIGTALFGVTAVMGPVLGPILGGYLAEFYSWHYCFFINLPVGIGLFALLMIGVKAEPMQLDRLRDADVLGIIGLALGLGALTVVLEEGQRDNWFDSELIRNLAGLSFIGFICLFAGQFVAKRPVIALKILKIPAFAGVFVMSLVVGGALYGTLYLVPQYLSEVSNYNSYDAGLFTAISGGPTMALMVVFPLVLRTIGMRYLVAFGLILYGSSCLSNSFLSSDAAGPQLVQGQLLRGVAMFFSLLMLNQAAATAVSKEYAPDASGLFNAARNLGGSFGLALIATMQERRGNFHHERIVEALDMVQVRAKLPNIGLAQLNQLVDAQSNVMTYNDMFFVFSMVLFATVPLVFFLKTEPVKRGPQAGG